MAGNEGVVSVAIDIEQELVKISGKPNLDPSTILKTIAKSGKLAQFRTMENTAATAATAAETPAVSIDSNHQNTHSGNSDDHCNKIYRTENCSSCSGHFSDRHRGSGDVHINEAATVNPPVALPHANRPFMRPPSQFGSVGGSGRRGFWRRMIEPLPPPPLPSMPPAHRYHRWSEPLPYYYQQQPPPLENAPGHYLFNDENLDGCVMV